MSTYYFLPTRNVFGEGAVNEAGALMKSLGGSNCMIVTDAFLAKVGMADRVKQILEDEGLTGNIFGGAEPNPTDKNVEAGVEFFKEHNCDSIISLGGGSSHDCAKGIGMVAANGGRIHDYEGIDKSSKPMVPLMSINTTAGTASEITRFCIITDTSRKVKMAIIDWRVTPAIAINDPELMKGMPASLTAATGMDALTHAVEAYVSTEANPLTDAAAIMAIKMITHYLPKAVSNGDYMKARDRMAYAQYLAGIAFNNASLGYVHAMAHQLGGYYNLPHGVCNAILLPYVEKFNLIGNIHRFRDIAVAMGVQVEGLSACQAAEAAIDAMRKLGKLVGIPADLKQLGVKPEDFAVMAENAMKDVCQLTNPRKATLDQIIGLYAEAYEGEKEKVVLYQAYDGSDSRSEMRA
ncbi:MAG: iron-containing alcohol dehydrogenase [Eubacteriaceae bacterium]|jgi:alcohol dehydrogenase